MNISGYDEAVSCSLYNVGNSQRLKKALSKNKVNIAFTGGSITKGWDGTGYLEQNYTDYVMDYLRNKYSDTVFETANLSTESANSFIGLSITDKVIDEVEPDIVLLEYAVNNECGHDHIVSFESLVNRMLSLPSEPAVILVFLINKALYTCQGYMKRIGAHYGLTSVSAADSLKKLLDEGVDWSVYADDVIHPNPWGHRLIADCIIYSIDQCLASEDESTYSLPEPLYSLGYADYRTYSAGAPNVASDGFESRECPEFGEYFSKGISLIKGRRNATVRFEGEFKTLFAAYVHDKTDRFSDADIIIDGEKKAVLQGKSIYGWGNVTLKNVFSFESKGKHSVELKVKDSRKEFMLIEFGVS